MTFDEKRSLFYRAVKSMPRGETRKQLEKVRENSYLNDESKLLYLLTVEALTIPEKAKQEIGKKEWIEELCNEEDKKPIIDSVKKKVANMTKDEIRQELQKKMRQIWKETPSEKEDGR